MIRNYLSTDAPALLALWNTAAVRDGFAPMDETLFHKLLLGHPDFDPALTFVLE